MFPFCGLLTASSAAISLPASGQSFDFGIWPGTVKAGVYVDRDGLLKKVSYSGQDPAQFGTDYWMAETGQTATIGDSYEVQATVNGSTTHQAQLLGSNLDEWITINGLIGWWFLTSSKFASYEIDLDIQVRQISNPANITSTCVWSLQVWNEFE